MNTRVRTRATMLIMVIITITAASTRLKADTGTCGGLSTTLPFTDVAASNIFFCAIAEAYVSGLTNGTSATTFSPSDPVTRQQMAAFITRTMDQSLIRGSKRAVLDQFWNPQGPNNLALTSLGSSLRFVKSDGSDLWVANQDSDTVSRVRASDGKKLSEWNVDVAPTAVLVAMGKVFITGLTSPGRLYEIDPTQAPGFANTVTSSLGGSPAAIAFDGQHVWTANQLTSGTPGSVSIVTLSPSSVTTVTTGFSNPFGIIYDGTNIWVTDHGDGTLKKLDSSGNILMSVPLAGAPTCPAFDGTNIWVPCPNAGSLVVVRATGPFGGTVLAKLTGNGLQGSTQAAFDGERILVTNTNGDSVSLWKASDLTPIGTFSLPAPAQFLWEYAVTV
jgi:S-layer homology domain